MNKKFISTVLAALMLAGLMSVKAFAAIPSGTVVIGNNAFNFAYANDPRNIDEITDAIVAGGAVYCKNFGGIWINNSTLEVVSASKIPTVIYTDANGKKTNFDPGDTDHVNSDIVNVSSVSLNKTTDILLVGATEILKATITPTNATNKDLTWKSSNINVATVDNTGKVSAISAGTANITVTTLDGNMTDTCTITINNDDINNTDITSKFTDSNFKEQVYSLIGKTSPAAILVSDVKDITELELSDANIGSLSGIEYFTALTYLDCDNNQLIELYINKNTALTDLYCFGNLLTSLDLSKNRALINVDCSNNKLSTFDTSMNIALKELYYGSNHMAILDLSNNKALTILDCDNNQVNTLDISKNTALTELYCYSNLLQILDLSNNTALTILDCDDNQQATLDLSDNTALTDLYCYNNQLTTLDLSKNTALTALYGFSNQLTTLDLSKNIALTDLDCSDNQIRTLNISNNKALINLGCYYNLLTTLDLSKNIALTYLDCSDNQIKTLNISNNIALTDLYCYSNKLTTLDLSKNAALNNTDCSYNNLTTLKINKSAFYFKNVIYSPQYINSTQTTTTDKVNIITN